MEVRIDPQWKALIGAEFEKEYFAELVSFVKQEYATHRIFPAGRNIFRAFEKCKPDDLKVVIIGQDPYHGVGQANGLCFSVNDGVPFPPSLVNIFQEVKADVGAPIPTSGNLDRWAEQGVLLLNAVLTVRAHEAASHAGAGWERFTDAVVRTIAEHVYGSRGYARYIIEHNHITHPDDIPAGLTIRLPELEPNPDYRPR